MRRESSRGSGAIPPSAARRGRRGAWWASGVMATTVLLLTAGGPGVGESSVSSPRLQAVLSRVAPAEPPPRKLPATLLVDQKLLSKLGTLADGLRTEVVLCLRGAIRGDTARATDFFMPEPRLSTTTKAVFEGCPGETLAAWHNHPPALGGGALSQRDHRPTFAGGLGPGRAADLCVLTEKDIATASRLGHPFAVVAVDAETWCWWTLEQVRRMDGAPGRPIPGQGMWTEPAPLGVRGGGR